MPPGAEAMAETVVLAFETAIRPVLAKVTSLAEQVMGLEARWADLNALRDRVAVMEMKEMPLVRPERGEQGKPGEPGKDGESIKGDPGKDGTSVTLEDVAPLIVAEVAKAVSALPPPINGKDGESVKGEQGDPGLPGKDGSSVTVNDVAPLITSEVAKAVHALPRAIAGKDGLGLVSALVDRDGHLVMTMSDGSTKNVGTVVGRDVDRADVVRVIAEEVAKFPKPLDGKDGFGFDDFDFEYDEHGRLSLKFARGDQIKRGRVPGHVDRGVYKQGDAYLRGDEVSFGGGLYIAQKDIESEKPGDGSGGWRLAVKAGRDGRDARATQSNALPIMRTK
jgi:hypothetical protein